jgi:hypothetical protein
MDKQLLEDILKDNAASNMLFVSLVSADSLINVDSCKKSLKMLRDMERLLPEVNLSLSDKERFSKLIDKSIGIVNRDLEKFKKTKKNHN